MFCEKFRADIDRYVLTTGSSPLFCLVHMQGLWALAEYRFSHWVWASVRVPVVRQLLRLVGIVWHKVIELTTGIDLPADTTIGRGLYIAHFGGIIVHGRTVMGENCNLSHGVTIGIGGRGEQRGVPVFGDRVFIGPGAVIVGPIRVGNDVVIGANAVVIRDLPDQAVAVGVPPKVVSLEGSADYVQFRPR